MPVPSPRNKILPARGNYSDLLANVASIGDGEICYAIDQDQYYQNEGGTLVAVGATKAQGALADTSLQPTSSIDALADVDTTTAAPEDGQALIWNDSLSQWEPGGVGGEIEWTLTANGTTDYIFAGSGFAGTETDPVLYVVRGQTYKFTNAMGAHPFQIQSTSGIGGTAYNDGITNNAVSNGTLAWEVRMDAPSTLYYQCTSHADMNGTIYVLDEGSAIGSINDLSDVDTATVAPTDGQVLAWDNTAGKWEPASISGGGGSVTVAATAPLSPGTGDMWYDTETARLFVWTSTEWVDAAPDSGYAVATTSDTAPANANDGDLWFRTTDGRMYVYYNDGTTSQWVDANPNLPQGSDTWVRSGTDVTLANAGDNVGIGTTSPGGPLEVQTASGERIILDSAGSNQQPRIQLNRDGGTDYSIQNAVGVFEILKGSDDIYRYASDIHQFYTVGSERMRIDSSGNVGIGTASPEAKLHVEGGSIRVANSGVEGGELQFTDKDGSNVNSFIDVDGTETFRMFTTGPNRNISIGQIVSTGGMVNFYTSASERMRIDSSGNVGLGTSAPRNLLEVKKGSNAIEEYPTDLATFAANITNAVDGNDQHGLFVANRWAGPESKVVEFGSLYGTVGAAYGSYFVVNGIGNVGIGTDNPGEKLVVEAAAAVSGFSQTNINILRSNYGGQVGGYIDQGVGHGLTFSTVDNGTPTERMRINSSGTASFSGTVETTERTITAGAFDLATGNHWTCGAITVPAPTNAAAGTSGLIRITAGPVTWNTVFKFPGGTAPTIASFPAVIPFYVQDSSNILMGNAAEGIA